MRSEKPETSVAFPNVSPSDHLKRVQGTTTLETIKSHVTKSEIRNPKSEKSILVFGLPFDQQTKANRKAIVGKKMRSASFFTKSIEVVMKLKMRSQE